MLIQIKVACDGCLEDYEIEIRGDNAKDTWKKLQRLNLRNKMMVDGWHVLKNCLCPFCKERVGEENCLNCRYWTIKHSNSICGRPSDNQEGVQKGFYLYDGSFVSEYDCCPHFVARK